VAFPWCEIGGNPVAVAVGIAAAVADKHMFPTPGLTQKRYARLLVRVGLNVHKGQSVVLWKAPVESQALIRKIAEECYKAGASNVDVYWFDPELDRLRLDSFPSDCCAPQSERLISGMETRIASGASVLLFDCTCAGVFDGIDPKVLECETSCETKRLSPAWEELNSGRNAWTVATAPNLSWALQVYPAETPSRALRKLWNDIAFACRLTNPTYEFDWAEHVGRLSRVADRLNERHYSMLHYRGPKADLCVRLPDFHKWRGPDFVSNGGFHYVPDIPMEEVFTLPHRSGVDGWIASDVPFIVKGEIIQGMKAIFEKGLAVKVSARQGEGVLSAALDTDEGARRLGEVALVPLDSPTSQLGRLYYNTILDENAACHLAFGRAYRFAAQSGESMSSEEFVAAGGNASAIHIDFMIDSTMTEIWGILADGREERIFPTAWSEE